MWLSATWFCFLTCCRRVSHYVLIREILWEAALERNFSRGNPHDHHTSRLSMWVFHLLARTEKRKCCLPRLEQLAAMLTLLPTPQAHCLHSQLILFVKNTRRFTGLHTHGQMSMFPAGTSFTQREKLVTNHSYSFKYSQTDKNINNKYNLTH